MELRQADGAESSRPCSNDAPLIPFLRRSISAPNLGNGALAGGGLEVYVVQRPFTEFGASVSKRLPPSMNRLLLDLGVCHFMTVFKSPSGQLVQFDFGPRGGRDISLGNPSQGRMARLFGKHQATRAVPAEIREAKLLELPETCLYVGRTRMTLQEVRRFNSAQALRYEVHKSDCRHYVDRLCRYATGFERAAASAAKHTYKQRRARHHWTAALTACTDVRYYNHVKGVGQASLALITMVTTRGTFGRLLGPRALLAPQAQLVMVPARRGATTAISRRLLPSAAAGVAVAAWTDAPVVRSVLSVGSQVGEGVRTAAGAGMRAAMGGVSWLGRIAHSSGSKVGDAPHRVLRLPFRQARARTLSIA